MSGEATDDGPLFSNRDSSENAQTSDTADQKTSIDGPINERSIMVRKPSKAQSLAEKLSFAFHKLTWRTPIQKLRLSGNVPLRLLAKPNDPVPPNPQRGLAIKMGKFAFRDMDIIIENADFAELLLPPSFINYIHRYDWLRDIESATNRGEAITLAEQINEKWLNECGKKPRGDAWRPEIVAWRFLNMAAHSPLILSSRDPVYRSLTINHFARMARYLDHSAGKEELGLPRIAAWCGVLAASLLLPENNARRIIGEHGLESAIIDGIFPDGGVISRSPLHLITVVELLTYIDRCFKVRDQITPDFIKDALTRCVSALRGLTHADGSIAAWQGSPHISSTTANAIIDASNVRVRPQRQALDWGYQRVPAGNSVLLVDAAPPPAAKQSATGCASTLAIEFSHEGQHIFQNCGGAAMLSKNIPATLARGLRTTAAHSTLCIADSNSTAILVGGKLGAGVNEVELDRREVNNGTRIESSHDGYLRPNGFTHRRILILRDDGLDLRGEDILLPNPHKKVKKTMPYHIRFHLGANVEITPNAQKESLILRMANGSTWLFHGGGSDIQIDDSLWVDENGLAHPTKQLVITGEASKGGANNSWQLRFIN